MKPFLRTALLVLLTLVIPASFAFNAAAQSGAVRGGPLPQLFPADNWWNIDISSAPVDPNSTAFINFIGPTDRLHPDLGGDCGASCIYGMPYATVAGTQPLVPVTFYYAGESDPGAPGRPPGYPIPEDAKTETRWIEGGPAGNDPAASGDRHMLIVDRDNRILYELFDLRWNTTLGRWEAGSGAVWPLDSNLRRPDGWTSADAAGLAILPGLVRYDEAYGTQPIRHALRFTVMPTNGYVFPASHRAGPQIQGALPMGARLRLKASKDISGYPEAVRRIFQAMKTYGLILADNGTDMMVGGTNDPRWNNDIMNPAFHSLHASDFEVIQLGWKPSSVPPCTPPTITSHPGSSNATSGQTLTLSVGASGTAPLSYQWYSGAAGDTSSPVTGATLAALTVTVTSSTSRWVRVVNACGSADSNAAQITVTPTCTPASGDLNMDGSVNAADSVILANHLAGNIAAGTSPFSASATMADLNSSGGVNVVDSVILANHLARNVACLPAP